MVTLGNASVYIAGAYIDWQWLAFSCGMVPLVGLILMVFTPASPTYLLSRGRVHDAIGALMSLRGAKYFKQVQSEFEQVSNLLTSILLPNVPTVHNESIVFLIILSFRFKAI